MSGSRKQTESAPKKKTALPVIITISVIAAVLLIGAVAAEVIDTRRANTEVLSAEEYFSGGGKGLAVIRDNELSAADAFCDDGQVYVSTDWLKTLNSRFYYDAAEKLLIYTVPEGLLQADAGTVMDGRQVLRFVGNTAYVYLPYAAAQTDMEWELIRDPDRILIRTDFSNRQTVDVKEGATLRESASNRAKILLQPEEGTVLTLLERDSTWAKAATADGYIGYIRCDQLGTVKTVKSDHKSTEQVFPMVSTRQGICLVWDMISVWDDNAHLEEYMAKASGVNVISPTWLRISDSEGHFDSLASSSYVERAHAMGLQVWILVNNMDNEIYGEALTQLLNRTSTRQTLVVNLVAEALSCGADGINVDIESLPSAAGDGYIQFIRELSVTCHAHGLVLSVDNYVPSPWTSHYHRAEQAVMADYVIVMGYDEHYAGSEPGSTASLGFVVKGVKDTLEEVPASKVINAVPFYSRLWRGAGNSLTSSVLSMAAIRNYIVIYDLSPIWDAQCGQGYAEFSLGSTTARLWIEDNESMATRLTALQDYHLAGLAAWRLGLENDDIWPVFENYFRN